MERFKSESDLNQNQPEQPKESSSARLRLAFKALVEMQVGEVTVRGGEHLKEIPPNRKLIIATTHLSDLDMPLAANALTDSFDLAIVNMSVHHSMRPKTGEPTTFAGIIAAGKDNFIPVDFSKDPKTGEKTAGIFNPENFEPMQEALDKGKRVMIAAHNPSHNFEINNPGYGAAYLAELSEAMILPVAVNLESEGGVGMYGSGAKTFLKKPKADVIIGVPFELQPIEGLSRLGEILAKRKVGEKLSSEDRQEFLKLSSALRVQSEQLLMKITELLPKKDQLEQE
jgi:hypothetical protein